MYFLSRALGVCPTTSSTKGKLSCYTVLTWDVCATELLLTSYQHSKRQCLTEERERERRRGVARPKENEFFPNTVVEVKSCAQYT